LFLSKQKFSVILGTFVLKTHKGDPMLLGVPREMRLTSAKEAFLLDCKAVGFSKRTLRAYENVLTSFITSAGDILVRELGPDHVRMYITDLADYQAKHSLMKHYAVVRIWIRWMYAQKSITQRDNETAKTPRLRRGVYYFASIYSFA
jgi:site-specific recombinase XerD